MKKGDEWIELIREARDLGLSKEEVRQFLRNNNKKLDRETPEND